MTLLSSIIPSGRREMYDTAATVVGYFSGLVYALMVFGGIWDVQRKKGSILGESLKDSEEMYKSFLGIWALGFLFNPLAYSLSESPYLAIIDGFAAFTALVIGILAYRRYRFFKTQQLLQEAIAKGVEIGMKKAREEN